VLSGWSLFLDESGDFDDDGATRVVAGLLIERSAAALTGMRIREALGDVWGPAPFPPHAAHLNLASSLPIYAAWRPSRGGSMPEGRVVRHHRQVVRAAASALERAPHTRALLEEAQHGRLPSYDGLRDADAWLRTRDAGVHRALERVQAERAAAMADLLERVFRRLDGGATIVAARADVGGVEPAVAVGGLRADAYVRTLSVVAERVARVAGGANVDVHVLTRDVEVEGLGTAEIGPRVVREVMAAASSSTGSTVRFRPARNVQRYEDRPEQGAPFHPFLAFADWLANRLRHHLQTYPGVSWARLAEGLVLHGIAPSAASVHRVPIACTHAGALPMIAAAGIPEDAVRAAFAARPLPPLPSGWAGDQARTWTGAAVRWA
jgi:hypothetical protein